MQYNIAIIGTLKLLLISLITWPQYSLLLMLVSFVLRAKTVTCVQTRYFHLSFLE
ncbi:hypothetical protein SRDD_28290 [Serratia sp. DD3]|nr:hypothetical protein SRDD_28290 [Serratia sp. DD3]